MPEPKLSEKFQTDLSIFGRRGNGNTEETKTPKIKIVDRLKDESRSEKKIEALGPFLQHLLDTNRISQEKCYRFKESVSKSLTECKTSEGLTFDSHNALELTKIANEALFASGIGYICRVGILEKGQGFKAYVLADGTVIFSQEMINQFIDMGDPDAVVGVLAHELGHVLNETAATLVNAEDLVNHSAFGWAHEMGGDGVAPLILSRLKTKTDLLERALAILRRQQNGRSRGVVHQSHLSRESTQVAIRSKVHLKGGDRHFNFERKEAIPTNEELLREHLEDLNEITYEDLSKLSDRDLNAFFSYRFYTDGSSFGDQTTGEHMIRTKKAYIKDLATANNISLDDKELKILEIAFNHIVSFDDLFKSPDEILEYLDLINDQEFVYKFNTILLSSRIDYLVNSSDELRISDVFRSIFSHIYRIYNDNKDSQLRRFTTQEIEKLILIFDNSPFLSEYSREMGYYSVVQMLMDTLNEDEDWDESKIQTHLRILKVASEKTRAKHLRGYSDKEMVEDQLQSTFMYSRGEASEGFTEFLKKAFRELYGREIDYKPPEIFLSWDELQTKFTTQFDSLENVNDLEQALEILDELSEEMSKTINQRPFEQPASMEEIQTFFEQLIEPIPKLLRSLFNRIDLSQNQKVFNKLLAQYKKMYQKDSWFFIHKTEDEREKSKKEKYAKSKKEEFALEYQNIILDFSSDLSLANLHGSLDTFRAIMSNQNDLSQYNVDSDEIVNHPVWQIFQERYQQEFPLDKIEDFLEFKKFLDQRATGHLRFNNIYRDDFYGVAIFSHARERLQTLISESSDDQIPLIIEVLISLVDTSIIDMSSLISQLRWAYLRSNSAKISFEDKCQFWIDNAIYFHESGLNELARQVKIPADAQLLQKISQEKLNDILAGKNDKSEMTVAYMADLAFELFGNDGALDLIESCLPDNKKSSTQLALRWFRIHRNDFRLGLGKVEAKLTESFSSDLIRFEYYKNLTIKQLISKFQNLPVETKVGIFARLLSGDSSPLYSEEGRKRLADIVCQFAGEKGNTTELLLRGAINAEDQAYLVHIVSQGLGPSLFDGFSIDAINKHKVARSMARDQLEVLSARNVVNQFIQFDEVDVEREYKSPYLINSEFAKTSNGLKDRAYELEEAISLKFLKRNLEDNVDKPKRFEPSDRVKVLEKTGAHLVKGMQISFQLLPELTPEQREELADSQDSMQAISDYWFLVNLNELAKTDPRVEEFVDSIIEYGGAHPEGAYVGGGSLFSVYRVKARLSDGSERWVVVKMIRPEASDFNQRSIRFVDNVLENAQDSSSKKQSKQIDLLAFISQLAGQWTEEEIINENNLELETRFRKFIADSGMDEVIIPELILTTDELRVEFEVEGNTLNREIRKEPTVDRRVALLEKFLEFIELQLNSMDICHPDPHLGNLLVEPSNGDRLDIIDINRLIDLTDREKEVFRALIQGDSSNFLNLFVNLFNQEYRTEVEFSLSSDEVNRLIRGISQKILKNRIRNVFKGGVNPFLEWQLVIESLVESGMRAEDFNVDWQLMFRMIALRNSIKEQINELM